MPCAECASACFVSRSKDGQFAWLFFLALERASRYDSVPVSTRVALNVSRSTTAAQGRGSVKVRLQPVKASLEAIAMLFLSSRSVRTWKSISAPRRSSSK